MDKTMDTTMYMSLEDYLKFLADLEFQVVLKAPFIGREWKRPNDVPKAEDYYILWRSPVLVSFDTFGNVVNGGFVWYNWLPNEPGKAPFSDENGYWKGDIWVGNYDCRIDFKRKIDILEREGTLVSPWVEHQDLWLVNYTERYEGDAPQSPKDYKPRDRGITREKVQLLPPEVRDCIGTAPQEKEEIAPKKRPSNETDSNQEGRCGC
jgi:hypothetical protein